jgi:hypothetical protein
MNPLAIVPGRPRFQVPLAALKAPKKSRSMGAFD